MHVLPGLFGSGLTGPGRVCHGMAWPCTEWDFRWRFIFTFHACKTRLRVEVEIRARDVATLRQRPQRWQQQHINMNTNMTDTNVSLCASSYTHVHVCTCASAWACDCALVCESVWSEHRVKISEPQTVNSYRAKLQLLYASPTTSTNRVSKKDSNNNNESSGKVKMTIKPRQRRRWQTNECEHERACTYIHANAHTWSYIRMHISSMYECKNVER